MSRKRVRSSQNFHPMSTSADSTRVQTPPNTDESFQSIPEFRGNYDKDKGRRSSTRLELRANSRASSISNNDNNINSITSPIHSSKESTPDRTASKTGKQRNHYLIWTPEEDNALIESVRKHGTKIWSKVAEAVPTRSVVQCQNRFHGHLKRIDPSLGAKESKGWGHKKKIKSPSQQEENEADNDSDHNDNDNGNEEMDGMEQLKQSSKKNLPGLPSKKTGQYPQQQQLLQHSSPNRRNNYADETPLTAPASPIVTSPWSPEEDQYLVATVRDLDGSHSHMWTWLGKLMSRDAQDCKRRYDELTEIWGVKEVCFKCHYIFSVFSLVLFFLFALVTNIFIFFSFNLTFYYYSIITIII